MLNIDSCCVYIIYVDYPHIVTITIPIMLTNHCIFSWCSDKAETFVFVAEKWLNTFLLFHLGIFLVIHTEYDFVNPLIFGSCEIYTSGPVSV